MVTPTNLTTEIVERQTGHIAWGKAVSAAVNELTHATSGAVVHGEIVFNVKRYGAKGDWNGTTGTDDTTAIQVTFNTAQTFARRAVVLFPGCEGYKTTSTVTALGNVDLEMNAPIIFAGSAATALVVGTTGANGHLRAKHRIRVQRATQSDWTTEADLGVQFVNHDSCTIDLAEVSGFTVGAQFMGKGALGSAYNNITVGRLFNNKISVDLTNATGGWCNENKLFGGCVGHNSGTHPTLDRTALRITSSDGTYLNNNHNVWYSPSFEIRGSSGTPLGLCVDAVHAGPGNRILDARHEGNSAKTVITRNASFPIYFTASYDNSVALTAEELSSKSGTIIEGETLRVENTAKRLVFKADSLHKRACYYNGSTTVNVPGLAIQTSSSAIDDARAATNLAFGDDYLTVPVARAIGIYVSTRTVKRFTLVSDTDAGFGGRWTVRAYDSAGAVLSAAGTVKTNNGAIFTYTANYGGSWRTPADSNAPKHMTVSAATDYVFVAIGGNTADARVRSFSIFALDESAAPATWLNWVDNGQNYGTAAPTAGTWEVGRRIYNVAPTASGTEGWICTAAGSPGTWRTFGAIGA
jgi:hypothetical protein